MTTVPGLTGPIYLGGYVISRGLASIDLKYEDAWTRQRARDGSLLVDRASPYTGCADLLRKVNITLGWPSLTIGEVRAINRLIARGGPHDVVLWNEEVEAFTGTGTSGTLARRVALSVLSGDYLPAGASTRYATTGTQEEDESSVAITLGSVDANYRTPWTGNGTTGCVTVSYAAVYRCYFAEGQPTFALPHQQGQNLRLEES